jgi:hypothetical protein
MQKGQPYYMGNRALREASFRSPVDTPLGARFRAAGLITLRKTNLPEFGMQSTKSSLIRHSPDDRPLRRLFANDSHCSALQATSSRSLPPPSGTATPEWHTSGKAGMGILF